MRLFIAVYPPEVVVASIVRGIEGLRSLMSGFRWTRPEMLHCTLKFLGEVDDALLPDVSAAVKRAAGQSAGFEVSYRGVEALNTGRGSRVLGLGVDRGARELGILAEGVDRALSEKGFATERRTFRPHMTIARSGRRPPTGIVPAAYRDLEFGLCRVERLCLMRSILTPDGAQHQEIGSFSLVPAQQK